MSQEIGNLIPELANQKPGDLKIILLGDSFVGKSKLVERLLMGEYQPHLLSTYALNVFKFKTKMEGNDIDVDFWDTGGQERFASMHPAYYFQAHSCILVFDTTEKETYKNLSKWLNELRQFSQIPVLLVGNKIDVEPLATKKKYKFAETNKLPILFTSAKDGANVVRCFETAIEMGWEFKKTGNNTFVDDVLSILDSFPTETVS